MRRFLVLLLLGLPIGCDSVEGLPCDGPSFTVFVPAERAGDVTDLSISGDLCSENRIDCISHTTEGDCLEWWITPVDTDAESGQCQVNFAFACDLPAEQVEISWMRHHAGDCDGVMYADPRYYALEGASCADLETGGAAGSSGAGGGSGAAGVAGSR